MERLGYAIRALLDQFSVSIEYKKTACGCENRRLVQCLCLPGEVNEQEETSYESKHPKRCSTSRKILGCGRITSAQDGYPMPRGKTLTKHLRKFFSFLGDSFGLIPGVMVVAGILMGVALVHVDASGMVPRWLIDSAWLYNGGSTGARTLLGVVAGSTIGVAGTVFSITIAALSLAAGQMGPRLLRNFTRDRGNQITLGAFLGTFSYSLMVLRSVRAQSEGEFTPHLSMSVSIVLAFICVGMLVYFVGHMAGRINVDTVIELVSGEVRAAISRVGTRESQQLLPAASTWHGAVIVNDSRRGYVEHIDTDRLAHWADEHQTQVRLLVRTGDYVFPGAAIAFSKPNVHGLSDAIGDATILKVDRSSADDLEYAVRQLVEVAVRALSPGINDPQTAMNALDRLGVALCDLVPLTLPNGAHFRKDRCVLAIPVVDYGGLVDAMFHLIRQNATESAAVLIRMLEVLTAVAGCERDSARLSELGRHAGLIWSDAERDVKNSADRQNVYGRYMLFVAVASQGSTALIDFPRG